MITSTNSYILSYKGDAPKIEEREESEDTNTFNLRLKPEPRKILNNIFHLKDTDWKEVNKFFSHTIEFNYSLEEIHSSVDFELFKVAKDYYVNVGVTASTKLRSVTVLESLNNRLFKTNAEVDKDYKIFISYDAISEYYCNKIYPKLAKFERSLRRLLYNLYILNYGESYQREAISSTLTQSANKKNGTSKNKEDAPLTQFFYSLDFSQYTKLLFTKEWLPIDQLEKDKFLGTNKKLGNLPEEKLRKFVENLGPKTGWERFFPESNNLDLEHSLDELQKYRNMIAHNKIFTSDVYHKTLSLLNRLTKTVTFAIGITQQKDFPKKNIQALIESLDKFEDSYKAIFFKYSISLPGSLESIIDPIEQLLNSNIFQNSVDFQKYVLVKKDQEKSIEEKNDSESTTSRAKNETDAETVEGTN